MKGTWGGYGGDGDRPPWNPWWEGDTVTDPREDTRADPGEVLGSPEPRDVQRGPPG